MENNQHKRRRSPASLIIALLVVFTTAAIAMAGWNTIDTDTDDIDSAWDSITPVYTDSTNDGSIDDRDEIKQAWYTFDGDALYFRVDMWNSHAFLSNNNKRAIAALDCNGNGVFNDTDQLGGPYGDRLAILFPWGRVDITDGGGNVVFSENSIWGDIDAGSGEWQAPLKRLYPECRGLKSSVPLVFSIIDINNTNVPISQAPDAGDPPYSYQNPIDFGDAPNEVTWVNNDFQCDNYETKLPCDGPRHGITSLYLGANIDPDAGELADNPALADDANYNSAPDDEDGVAPSPGITWVAGGNGSLDVTVSGGSGYLNCWIDWNADEDFLDSGEHIVNDQAVTAGEQTISVSVPSGTSFGGPYMARCRISPNSGEATTPTGAVYGGEVEDNDWLIQPVDLSIAISGSDVDLTWSHLGQNDNEQAYRNTTPYFDYASATPQGSPGTSGSFTDSGVVGSPADTFYYKVVGTKSVSGSTLYSTPSKEVGLFEFDLVPGS